MGAEQPVIIVALLMLLALAAGHPAPAASHPAPPASSPVNRWAEPTRGILAQHCGSCHLPNLPTSVPRAMAVFNLTEEPWYARLTDEQYGQLVRRVRGTGSVPEADVAIVESFVQCAKDRVCP
jgi:mono/diheme cytochrome c family protein